MEVPLGRSCHERIFRFSLILVAGSVFALYGLMGVWDAVHQWTVSSPHCPPPTPGSACVELTNSGGLNTWQGFVVGIGCVAVGSCLFLLADRVKRRRTARPATN